MAGVQVIKLILHLFGKHVRVISCISDQIPIESCSLESINSEKALERAVEQTVFEPTL